MEKKNIKVMVGLSGGVDSAIAAYLLLKEGYDVSAGFMRNWDAIANGDFLENPTLNNDCCPQEADYYDAVKVAEKLGIKLYRIDFVKEYWDDVFSYFLDEYKKGRTPNPDIFCNKYIKFDKFLKFAKDNGFDYIATGHYAKLIDGKLYKALDLNKDQSYFLSMVKKEQFDNVLFPLGNINKETVRKIASEYGLVTADKKDSTGICFIGERNFTNFLKNYLPNKEGDIVNIDNNEVLGKHIGLMYYTIGQRRGLNIGGNSDKLYVVGKDLNKNILYVAYGDRKYLYSNKAILEDVNLLSDSKVKDGNCKFRYRQKDINCHIEYLDDKTVEISYDLTKAVTPGQICVVYNNDECILGGIIKTVFKDDKKLWYL